MLENLLSANLDVLDERDYMDTVCRSFANRLERRRTLLIISVQFYRTTEEVNLSAYICQCMVFMPCVF